MQNNGELQSYIESSNAYFFLNEKEDIILYNRFRPINSIVFKKWARGASKREPLPKSWLDAENDYRLRKPVFIPDYPEEYAERYLEILNHEPILKDGEWTKEVECNKISCDKKYDVFDKRGCIVGEIREFACEITDEEYLNILTGNNRINK